MKCHKQLCAASACHCAQVKSALPENMPKPLAA